MEEVSQEHLAFMKQIELENKQTILEYQNYSVDNFYNQGGFYDISLVKKAREEFIQKCIDINKYTHTNATFLRIATDLNLTQKQQVTLLSDIQYHYAIDEDKRAALANPMLLLMNNLSDEIMNNMTYTDHATCFCSENFLDFRSLNQKISENSLENNQVQYSSNEDKKHFKKECNSNKLLAGKEPKLNKSSDGSEWIWLNKVSVQATSTQGAVLVEIPGYHGYGIWVNNTNVRYPNPEKHPNNPAVGLKIEDNQVYKLNKLWNFKGDLAKNPPVQLSGSDVKPLLANKQLTQQRNYHKWEHAIPHDNKEWEKGYSR
ncbi:hypothetical protein [Spiroplasma sp. DGKH1]|uniref:hypothetical protein n=1 Tax=Spiroplasma sp. DGKH1 TaxID=3050074 RepID=UPI0034C6AFEF